MDVMRLGTLDRQTDRLTRSSCEKVLGTLRPYVQSELLEAVFSISELPQRLVMGAELGQDMVVMVPGGVHITPAMFFLEKYNIENIRFKVLPNLVNLN